MNVKNKMPTLIDTTQEIMDKLEREGKITTISQEKSKEINERINEKMEISRREAKSRQFKSRQKMENIRLNYNTYVTLTYH